MDDYSAIPPEPAPQPPAPPSLHEDAHQAWRAPLLRRLRLLMLAGISAFILTTWALVRVDDPLTLFPGRGGPLHVVRRHFEALNRGETRVAYDFFSSHYQSQIPYPHYEQLVADHRSMFRTREIVFQEPSPQGDRTVLETRVSSSNGRQYLVKFTLVRASGRWWIDAIRWNSAPDPGSFSFT